MIRYVVCTCNSLLREASIEAKQSGQRGISANDVRKVTEVRDGLN